MSLYTDTEEYEKVVEEQQEEAVAALQGVMRGLFGSVATRSLEEWDVDRLRSVLYQYGESLAREVEVHYVNEGMLQARRSSVNMLRTALATTAATRRDLTGEEPSKWVSEFVLGDTEVVDGVVSIPALTEAQADVEAREAKGSAE